MSRRSFLVSPLVLGLLLLLAGPARPGQSDIALFTGEGNAIAPNVMIIFDVSMSMRDKLTSAGGGPTSDDTQKKWYIGFQAIRDFITSVNPPKAGGGYVENARFGLTFYDKSDFGARIVVPIYDGNTQAILDRISTGWSESDDSYSGTPLGGALTDVARYYAGANTWGLLPRYGTLPMQAQPFELNVGSPIDLACRMSFVIIVSDGHSEGEKMDKYGGSDAANWCTTVGDADGDNAFGGLYADDKFEVECGKAVLDSWVDDVAYAAYRHDFSPLSGLQNITTHAIAFDIDDVHWLDEAAAYGGGELVFANDYQELYDAFMALTQKIFKSLVSFSNATIPSTRTQDEDAFFYSFFKPLDAAFWPGEILAFGLDSTGQPVDSNGDPLLSSGTGVIDPNAPSYWAAGELLKANTSRTLFTTKTGARTVFNTTNVTPTDLALTVAEIAAYPNYNTVAVDIDDTNELRDALVNYLAGKDAFDEDGDSSTTEMRDAALGDIFHSTPVAVGPPGQLLQNEEGYGPESTSGTFLDLYGLRDRVLYVGANDGMLHAFDAGSAGDNPSTVGIENDYYDKGTGAELFGYVPGLLLPTVKMIPRNNPRTYYYVDGSPAVADVWLGASHDYADPKSADEWTTLVMTGLREGGAGYMALDVTDPSATGGAHGPYPKFLWEFTDARLGEAWSTPVLTRVKVRGATGLTDHCGDADGDGDCREQWVAIFGGGYRADGNPNDAAYVSDPASASWSDRGKAIFMVSLDTGAVLARAAFDSSDTSANGLGQMKFAIPSAPAVLDLDFDGFADVVYIGDLGGQMWKWDISAVGEDTDGDIEGLLDNWTAGVFFRGYTSAKWSAGPSRYHSFFFPPAAAFSDGTLTLAFGSGEREDLGYQGDGSTTDDNNRFYVVGDAHPTGSLAFGSIKYEGNLTDVTDPTVSPDPLQDGFFFRAADAEKFVTEQSIFANQVLAASYTPPSSAPSDCGGGGGGTATSYIFDLESGAGYFVDAAELTGYSRKLTVGTGLPTGPKLTIAEDGTDKVYIKTSYGWMMALDAPPRTEDPLWLVYWRQIF